MNHFLKQVSTECLGLTNVSTTLSPYRLSALFSQPAADYDGNACNDQHWQLGQKKQKTKKQTPTNKATFPMLENWTWVTRRKLFSNSPQQCLPMSYRWELVIYCAVISYLVFTLTATCKLQQADNSLEGPAQAGNQCGRCKLLTCSFSDKPWSTPPPQTRLVSGKRVCVILATLDTSYRVNLEKNE